MSRLAAAWPVLLVVIVALAIAIVVYLVSLLGKAKKKSVIEDPEPARSPAAQQEGPAEGPAIAVKGGLASSFRQARRQLSRLVGGSRAQYKLPWVLLLGATGSRPRDLLAEAGLNLPFGSPVGSGAESGLAWWLLDHGVVLDLDGGYVLGSDHRSSDTLGWLRFLRLTQRYRPERPLDAVVLTLPAAELSEARRQGAAGLAELERRASALCQKLWGIEHKAGIRCPVYVLVTGCETVPGFAGFCEELGPRHSTEVLGWSNPYAVDTAYRPGWVAEAFHALAGRLGQVQLELYADQSPVTRGDDVFVFPEELAALQEPLAVYLDPVFKPCGYREGLLLRGIYFTGATVQVRAGAGQPWAQPTAFHHFVKGLLEHKVFRERGLAEPTRGTLLARNRRKLALQVGVAAVTVILLAGTLHRYFRLRDSQGSLEHFLEETAIHVGEVRHAREAGKPLDRGVVVRQARHLIEGMSNLEVDRFSSLFLPASWPWFTDLDNRLIAATVEVQEEILFRAIGIDLEQRAVRLTAAPLPAVGVRDGESCMAAFHSDAAAVAADPDTVVLTPVDRSPELTAWKAAVDELAELETAVERYNGLPVSKDLNHLAQVIEYLFDTPPPKAFFEHSRLYREALAATSFPPFEISEHEGKAKARVEALALRFYRRLFAGNEVLAALRSLAAELDRVAHGSWAYTAHASNFEELVARIELLETALAQPELDWARRPIFDLGPAHAEVLSEVSGSALLGSELAKRLRQDGEDCWRLMRGALADLASPVSGPLLVVDAGQPKLQLSTDTVFLKAALESFLGESFLSDADPQPFEGAPRPGHRLLWDVTRLEEAVALGEVSKRFESQTLALFPEAMRPAIGDVARAQLGARMEDLVARAQRFEASPEDVSPLLSHLELLHEIDSFALAVKPLNQLAGTFGRLHLSRREHSLNELVAEQGAGLLAEVDRLLSAAAPYRPRQGDFSWWNGEPRVALAAFGAADAPELEAYLASERLRVGELARGYAQPLVTWLGKSPIVRRPDVASLYRRWEGMLVALQEYDAKKPGNPLAELEKFILADMGEVDPGSCTPGRTVALASLEEGPSPKPPPRPEAPNDFFLWRRHDLSRKLDERCHALAADRARDAYDELAQFFNKHLAGKFPFAARAPEGFGAEAELADVEAFFELFDAHISALRNAQASEPATFGTASASITDFCDDMSEVRAFLASYLESSEPHRELTFDLDVDFRVLRPPPPGAQVLAAASAEREVGGERIIDWRMAVGEKEVTHRDTERHLSWRPGLPVRLGLRWAEDSPRLPAAPSRAPDGRTVLYEYTNRWSLLALLAEHPSRDPRPHTLRFVVQTEPNGALDGGSLDGERAAPSANGEAKGPSLAPDEPATQVYVRLTLRPPAVEGKPAEPLRCPDFPASAPQRQRLGERAAGRSPEVSR